MKGRDFSLLFISLTIRLSQAFRFTDLSNSRPKMSLKLESSAKNAKTPPRIYDSLFTYIEDTQTALGVPFGRLLDAGTGSHSLRWIAGLIHHVRKVGTEQETSEENEMVTNPLSINSYTAITADENMRRTVFEESLELKIEDKGDILIGNWASTSHAPAYTKDSASKSHYLLDGQKYDTIIADYLIGAMDGFSPYYQDQIFDRLSNHLNPGGYLYIVGLEPISDSVTGTNERDDNSGLITRVAQVRDACILLAGHRCYREYPLTWIVRQLEKTGFEVTEKKKFPIMYSHQTICRQIRVARSKLRFFKTEQLKEGMREVLDQLEAESEQLTEKSNTGRIRFGFDYVVCARRIG